MAIQDRGWIVLVSSLSIALIVAVSMISYNSQQRFSEYKRCQQGEEIPISTPPSPDPVLSPYPMYKHLASFVYISRNTHDYLYRCTAIILTPIKLLTTTKCVGPDILEHPNSALFGFSDIRNFNMFKDDTTIEIMQNNIKLLNDDLVLLELAKPIDFDQPAWENVSVASLCNEYEIEANPQFSAVGFAQSDNGSNCEMFRTRLVESRQCASVPIKHEVKNMYVPRTHLCFAPIPDDSHPSQNGGCTKCLMASTSVLHVDRFDGSICVAGIAMPTESKCVANNNPTYYTSIASRSARDFIGM